MAATRTPAHPMTPELHRIPPLPPRGVALFDLDHTLLEGDCGQSWVEFLAREGLAGAAALREQLHGYYRAYVEGRFDILDYTRFQLATVQCLGEVQARAVRTRWWEACLKPRLREAGVRVLEQHRAQGHTVVMATATHRFLVEPVAEWLAVDDLIATETRPTGTAAEAVLDGEAAFGPGKLARARHWCRTRGIELAECAFYSDSHNDLPLLAAVRHAYAVNPDERLREHATREGWGVLDWRSRPL